MDVSDHADMDPTTPWQRAGFGWWRWLRGVKLTVSERKRVAEVDGRHLSSSAPVMWCADLDTEDAQTWCEGWALRVAALYPNGTKQNSHPWPEWARQFQTERDEARAQRDAAERERDVLIAQQRPLLASHDALVAAAGLPGAGASAEEMVAAVRERARREGAEAMREACVARFTQRVEYLHPWAEAEDDENGCHSGAWTEALNAVQFTRDMVLPLDAPGSAT